MRLDGDKAFLLLKPLWILQDAFWEPLGALLKAFGRLLGDPKSILGAFWELLDVSKRSWVELALILEAEMHAKVYSKGEKNEDETRRRFKSRLKQQQLILDDPPLKIPDLCCFKDVKTALHTLKKLIVGTE